MENLIEEFKKSIPPEDQDELVNALMERMNTLTELFQEEKIVFGIDDVDYVKKQTENELIKLINVELSEKKRELLTDNKLEKIRDISRNAFYTAREMLFNGDKKTKVNTKSDINKLMKLQNEVEEYNQETANMLVSEGILDLKFIANPQTDIVSKRLKEEIQEYGIINKKEGKFQ